MKLYQKWLRLHEDTKMKALIIASFAFFLCVVGLVKYSAGAI